MADVFVSYSRRDSETVQRIVSALQERGKDVWLDVDGIRDAEVFPAALRTAVEGSDSFVFVISPDSVASRFCEQEVEHALELNKRIVPLALRPVADEEVPEGIRVRNWIPIATEEDFGPGVERLVGALDTDLEHAREHTRWLLKALEWDGEGRDRSFLLRGSELAAAERWLAAAEGKQPQPTALHREYLAQSRNAATRRQRVLVAVSLAVAAISIALGIVALTQRNAARDQRREAVRQAGGARSRALAAESENQLAFDPELAILLGAQAVKTQPTPQAMFSLRRALDVSTLRLTLSGHRDFVYGVAFQPRGGLIATTSMDHTVRVWNGTTGGQVRVIRPGQAGAVVFTPDGRSLVLPVNSGGIEVYDAATGRRTKVFDAGDHVGAVRYGARGRLLVSSGIDFVKVWDARDLALRRSFTVSVDALRSDVSPDGRLVASGMEDGLRIWDLRSGRLVRFVPARVVSDAVFTRDGRTLVYVTGHHVSVLDGDGRGSPHTFASVGAPTPDSLALSPDGRRLGVGATDGRARLYDLATGRLIQTFAGHRCCVADVAFNGDGSELATASRDRTAKIWTTRGNELATAAVGRTRVTAVAVSPDGRRMAAATATGGAVLRPLAGSGPTIPVGPASGTRGLAWSRRGSVLAVAGADEVLRIADPATGRVVRSVTLPGAANGVDVSRDGSQIALAGTVGVTVYSSRTGARVAQLPNDGTTAGVAFDPRKPGELAEATADYRDNGALVLVRVHATGPPLLSLPLPNAARVVAFSPDGRLLLGATLADTTVKLYDIARRREVRDLFGHTGRVTAAAFSPDGRLVATASVDRTVRIWDPGSGAQLRVIDHAHPVTAVAFTPDGRDVVSGDDQGTVRVWDACTGCRSAGALLALAHRRVTRSLTPVERRTFLGGSGG